MPMPRWTVLALAAALLAGGCDTASAPAPAEAADPRFVAGDTHVYRFTWSVDAESSDTSVLPADLPLRGVIDLAGELAVRVAGTDVDGTYLAVSLRALDRHSVTALGESLIAEPGELLAREVLVLVPEDGDAHRLLVAPDAPPLFRHLMPGLLAHLDLRLPRAEAKWSATIPTGHGLAEVEYEQVPGDERRMQRRIRRYLRVDSLLDGLARDATTDGAGTVEVDARGVPIRIDSDELLGLAGAGESPAFQSQARFTLERVAVEAGEPAPWRRPDDHQELDLAAPPNSDEIERALAQRFAGGLTVTDMQLVVAGVHNGLLPYRGFTVAATGLLRGWPELAVELEATFLDHTSRHARSLVMDLLASAGTPESQQSMLRLLQRDDVRADPAYPRYLQRFSFVLRPLPGVAAFLLDLHGEDARDDVKQASLYVMGSVCDRLRGIDVVAAAALHRRLLGALDDAVDEPTRVAALAGIGNAADPADIDRVLAFIAVTSVDVRLQAASALRTMPDPRAGAALLRLLADPAYPVASQALVVLDAHVLTSAAPLSAAIEGRAYHPGIADELVSVLARRQLDDPTADPGLGELLRTTTDPRLRGRIEPLLAASPT